jgi:L-lysine exporter family protein LysE/ArgO
MSELSSLLIPWGVGFLTGYLACIPVGPVNVTIINEGARLGFRHALFVGLGAVSMEMIYSGIAFASFAQLFTSTWMRAIMELVSFVVVTAIGLRYLRTREMPITPHSVEVFEQRLHPHTAFMTGFIRVLGNPATLLFWIAFAAASVSHEWVDERWSSKAAAVCGIGMGALIWFSKLGYAVSLGQSRFSTRVLLRTAHISGALLLAAGVFMGARLVVALAKHRQQQIERRQSVPAVQGPAVILPPLWQKAGGNTRTSEDCMTVQGTPRAAS